MTEFDNADEILEDDNRKNIFIFNSSAIQSPSFLTTVEGLQKDPEYNITICDYVDDIIQMSAVQPKMMIFAAVTSKADVAEIVKMMAKLKSYMQKGFIKVLLFNYVKNAKVEQLFRKHGAGDFLEDNINPKSLGYKINLGMKAIETSYKKYEDEIKSSKEVKTFSSNTDPFSILSFIKPINQQFEIWSIANKKSLTFFNSAWDMEVLGPHAKLGKWEEGGGEEDLKIWRWSFHEESLQDEFSPDGTWTFEGRKPEFYTANETWKFSSKAPNFYFDSDLVTTFKIEFDEESMKVAKDSRMLFTNLSQLKTLVGLMDDESTDAADIKELLTGKKKKEEEEDDGIDTSNPDDLKSLLVDEEEIDQNEAQRVEKTVAMDDEIDADNPEHLQSLLRDEIEPTHEMGSSNGTEQIDENQVGESSGEAERIDDIQKGEINGEADVIDDVRRGEVGGPVDEISDKQVGEVNGEVDQIDNMMRGDLSEDQIQDEELWKTVDEAEDLGGYLKGDIEDTDRAEGLMLGEVDEVEDQKGELAGDVVNGFDDDKGLLEGISEEVEAEKGLMEGMQEGGDIGQDDFMAGSVNSSETREEDDALRSMMENEFLDSSMAGDIGPGLEVRNKYDVRAERKLQESEELAEKNRQKALEDQKRDALRDKLGLEELDNNMAGNGESADRLSTHWADPNHRHDAGEKQYNEWGGKASADSPDGKKGELSSKGERTNLSSNMEGSGESADDIDNYWRDPLHQRELRNKEYNKRQKSLESSFLDKDFFEEEEDAPELEITEDDPLKKKPGLVKNDKGNWVTEDEFLGELETKKREKKSEETEDEAGDMDNVLEFKKRSLKSDTQNIEIDLCILREKEKTEEDNEDEGESLVLISTDKIELVDIFDTYLIMKDGGNAYNLGEEGLIINFDLTYQGKSIHYKVKGNLEDIYEDHEGLKNLTFYITEGQEEKLDHIQEVYEKRQAAIISFFKQAKGF